MNKILRKNKKYIVLVLIAAIAFNFLFLPVTALAATTPTKAEDDTSYIGQAITWLSAKPILFAASLISSIFGAFFGLILSLEALIIDYIIDPKNFSLINKSSLILRLFVDSKVILDIRISGIISSNNDSCSNDIFNSYP